MRILWFSWKDITHPKAGGAEVVTHELLQRLAKNGHQATLITASYPDCEKESEQGDYRVIRMGSRYTVHLLALFYYLRNLRGNHDLIIEEVNTFPFFTRFYASGKKYLFTHQLARKVWFYEMIFPLSHMGYVAEWIYLWLLSPMDTITISNSTKQDLVRNGFKSKKISIISEGVHIETLPDLTSVEKYENQTILWHSAWRVMKRTDQVVLAFIEAHKQNSGLRLIMSGSNNGAYAEKVQAIIDESPAKDAITVMGRTTDEQKIELMQKCHLIAVTSIKEGWGLVVTESNSQGTPAVVYNVDGLRDSVQHDKTGIVCSENTPEDLAENIIKLLADSEKYERLRRNAWQWSKEITFDQSYEDFKKITNL